MIIRSNGIETVCHQKNLSNDIKNIKHMQCVLANNGSVQKIPCKYNMAPLKSKQRP